MSRYLFSINETSGTTKVIPYKDQKQIIWSEALDLFEKDREFTSYIIAILQQCKYQSFFWENSPVTASSYFEFVLINAPQLMRSKPDPSPFIEHIGNLKGTNSVVFFQNKGKNAYLVVPAQNGSLETYTHIANFVRNAPEQQIHELFRLISYVGLSLLQSLDKFWISTSGLGVSWLHVRNDLTPKYYSYNEFKS